MPCTVLNGGIEISQVQGSRFKVLVYLSHTQFIKLSPVDVMRLSLGYIKIS